MYWEFANSENIMGGKSSKGGEYKLSTGICSVFKASAGL